MPRHLNIKLLLAVAAVGAVLATGTAAASSAGDSFSMRGGVLLYRTTTGAAEGGAFDGYGFYVHHTTYPFTAGWTQITPVGKRRLLFYNAVTGAATVGRIDQQGGYANGPTTFNLGAGWTTVTYAGEGLVLLYNIYTGAATMGSVDGHGSYTTLTPAWWKLQRGWSQITYAGGNMLLFYNASTGAASAGVVSSTGVFTNLKNFRLAPGWTNATWVGGNRLLFYNADTGRVETGSVQSTGAYGKLHGYSGWFKQDWTAIVYAGSSTMVDFGSLWQQHVLFYDAHSRQAVVGTVNARGYYKSLRSFDRFTSRPTDVVASVL